MENILIKALDVTQTLGTEYINYMYFDTWFPGLITALVISGFCFGVYKLITSIQKHIEKRGY